MIATSKKPNQIKHKTVTVTDIKQNLHLDKIFSLRRQRYTLTAHWYMPVNLVLRRLRQENHQVKVSLGYKITQNKNTILWLIKNK